MEVLDLEIPPRKPITKDSPKPVTDRVTREPAEHPDRVPQGKTPHPVTRNEREGRSERIGAE